MIEPVQTWKWYWEATMPDGRVIPQFDEYGKKKEWATLPGKPQKVTLKQFSDSLARNVQMNSRLAAVAGHHVPIEIDNVGGGGLVAKRDTRYHITPMVTCLVCGHSVPFHPGLAAKCQKCGAENEWFCTDCQEVKFEAIADGPRFLCPDCKTMGKTRGLKRIQKFKIDQKVAYETHYVVEIRPFLELRVTDESIKIQPCQSTAPV